MGTVSSIEAREEKEQYNNSTKKKSIREQMVREFGKVANEEPDNDNNSIFVSDDENNTGAVKQMSINPSIFKARKLFMKPVLKTKPKEKKLFIKKQVNGSLLKEIYKRMDPSINHLSIRSIVGEIEVAIKYKISEEMLLVKIGRGKRLHQEDLNFPNPYVSVSLFEKNDLDNAVTCHTKVKLNTCNPVFQEILMFKLHEINVASSSLQISVWDKNEISEDVFLGQSVVELYKLNLNTGNFLWFKLQAQTDTAVGGSVDLTLTFNQLSSLLTVTVHQANDLNVCDIKDSTSHPFFRMYVTGIPSKEESEVINNSLDPVWNSDHEFSVRKDEFSRRILVINILSQKKSSHTIRLGDVHIPLLDVDWDERKTYDLQDLRNTTHSRSKWSEEGISMEFKEAMKAHAIYGYPKFLFKKDHVGKKMISCYSEKAKTQAKMIISNGILTLDEVQM